MNLRFDMKHYATLLLSASLGLGGCSAATGSEETGSEDTAFQEATSEETALEETGDPQESPVVAKVDVGYGSVVFYETRDADDNAVIIVGEMAPNDYATTPLTNIAPGHTALELFRAVAPEREVPAVILEAHERELTRLDRPTSEELVPVFDRDAPIEKTSQACQNFITPNLQCVGYGAVADRDVASGRRSVYLNHSSSYYTFSDLTIGFCNESDGFVTVRYSYGFRDESLQHYLTTGVSAGVSFRTFNVNMSQPRFCGLGLCGDVRYRARGITADAGPYGMRMAETYETCIF